MKKLGIIFATIVMLMLFVVSASALDASGRCGKDAYYTFDSATGELVITGTGAIAAEAFCGKNEIRTIIIEDGITEIGEYAFADLRRMKSVEMPDSVIIIDERAFESCNSLSEILLSKNLTSIGECAFLGCFSLEEIIISEKVKYIGLGAFVECISLDNIYVYAKNVEIDEYAFAYTDMFVDKDKCSIEEFVDLLCLYWQYRVNGELNLEEKILEELDKCVIEYDENKVQDNTVVHCYKKSAVEEYAIKFEINYVNFDEHEHLYTITQIRLEPTCVLSGKLAHICECGDEYITEIDITENHMDLDCDGFCNICEKLIADIENCDCVCHGKLPIFSWVYELLRIFKEFLGINLIDKLFNLNDICYCGVTHY